MTDLVAAEQLAPEVRLLKLAREIAMDFRPLKEILTEYKISQDEWSDIQKNKYFLGILGKEVTEWNSALKTEERVRLKSAAFLEEALPEFFARAHDKNENLNHKVAILQTVQKMAGLGPAASSDGGSGEKFSITINLGGDKKLTMTRDVTPSALDMVEGDEL
jgi:hypothetical protein